jgi:uncharacterized membrane protein
MLQLDLKSKITNPIFDIALVGAILVFLKSCHLDFIANVIPSNYADIISQFIGILVMLGVIINPNTKGISDQVTTNTADNTTITDVQNVANELNKVSNNVTFDNTGMTATGNLKVVSQDSTSQVEIKNDSVNASVQAIDNLNASSKINVDIPQE